MDVATLTATLRAEVTAFMRNMQIADQATANMRRSLAALEGASTAATRALQDVKVSQTQAFESQRVLDSMAASVSKVTAVAMDAADHLANVKLDATQAAATKLYADSMARSLDRVTERAVVAKSAMEALGFSTNRGIRIPGTRYRIAGAAAGSLAAFAGLGTERLITSSLGILGAVGGGLLGGGLLANGALGTAAVGMGTDMAGIGQAAGDIRTVTQDLTKLNDAIKKYGASSRQAATAQAQLNVDLNNFSPVARNAVLAAAQTSQQFKQMFDRLTGPAEKIGAEIIQQAMLVGEKFLPTIGQFAQQNMHIIQQQLQPLFAWLQNPAAGQGGLGIFTDLEKIFQRDLPTAMHAGEQAFELWLKTTDLAAQHLGNFIRYLDHLFTKWNSPQGWGRFSHDVEKLISLFDSLVGFLRQVGDALINVFRPALGFGQQFIDGLTQIVALVNKWLSAAGTQDVLHNLFQAHLQQLQAVFAVIKSLLPALESFVSAFLRIEAAVSAAVAGPLRALADIIGEITRYKWADQILGWMAAIYLFNRAVSAVVGSMGLLKAATMGIGPAAVASMRTTEEAAAGTAAAVDAAAASERAAVAGIGTASTAAAAETEASGAKMAGALSTAGGAAAGLLGGLKGIAKLGVITVGIDLAMNPPKWAQRYNSGGANGPGWTGVANAWENLLHDVTGGLLFPSHGANFRAGGSAAGSGGWQPLLTPAAAAAAGGGGLAPQLSAGALGKFERVDQGVDFMSNQPVPALGAGIITRISHGFTGGTGQAVYEQLYKPITVGGRTYSQIYYAEQKPLVMVGQQVMAGMPVMAAGGNELGFASGNNPVARLIGGLGAGTQATQAGQDFLAFVRGGSYAMPGGLGQPGPTPKVTYRPRQRRTSLADILPLAIQTAIARNQPGVPGATENAYMHALQQAVSFLEHGIHSGQIGGLNAVTAYDEIAAYEQQLEGLKGPYRTKRPRAIPMLDRILPISYQTRLANAQSQSNVYNRAGYTYAADVAAIQHLTGEMHKLTGPEQLAAHKEIARLVAQEAAAYKVLAKSAQDSLKAQQKADQEALAAKERAMLGMGADAQSPSVMALKNASKAISAELAKSPLADNKQLRAQIDTFNKILAMGFVPSDVREAIRERLDALKQTIGDAIKQAQETARQNLRDAQQAFEQGWKQIADAGDKAFSDATAAHVQDMQDATQSQVDGLTQAMDTQVQAMQDALTTKIDGMRQAADDHVRDMQDAATAQIDQMKATLDQQIQDMQVPVTVAGTSFMYGGATPTTPAEQQLAALQDQLQSVQDTNELLNAQQQLADANKKQDAQAAAQALRSITEIQLRIQEQGLQKQAQEQKDAAQKALKDAQDAYRSQQNAQIDATQKQLERQAQDYQRAQDIAIQAQQKIGDAQIQAYQKQQEAQIKAYEKQRADAVKAYEDMRALQQTAMQQQIADIVTQMENGTVTVGQGLANIEKVWQQHGVNMNSVSYALGGQIYTGLQQGLNPVWDLLDNLQKALKAAITVGAVPPSSYKPTGGGGGGGGSTVNMSAYATALANNFVGGGFLGGPGGALWGGLPPGFASGGFIPANPPYGTIVRVGEREGEYVVPASKLGGSGGGVVSITTHTHIHLDSREIATTTRRQLVRYGRRLPSGTDLWTMS